MPHKTHLYLKVALLNIFSVALLSYGLMPDNPRVQAVSREVTITQRVPLAPTVISGKPTRIFIQRLNIELPIVDGIYNEADDSWTLSDNMAHYATPTPVLNDQQGNTLIYGHNYDWIFGKLNKLSPGDTVVLHSDSGRIFTYAYERTEYLQPDDMTVFNPVQKPMLTLQTCSGNWNELRQMSYFRFVSVQ